MATNDYLHSHAQVQRLPERPLMTYEEQVADLEALQREIQVLTEELEATRPVRRGTQLALLLWHLTPWVGGAACVAGILFGLYWLWMVLPQVEWTPPAVVQVPAQHAPPVPAAPAPGPEGIGSLPLDSFLSSFLSHIYWLTAVLGFFVIVMAGVGYVESLCDNPFGTVMAGMVSVFLRIAVFGGLLYLLSTIAGPVP